MFVLPIIASVESMREHGVNFKFLPASTKNKNPIEKIMRPTPNADPGALKFDQASFDFLLFIICVTFPLINVIHQLVGFSTLFRASLRWGRVESFYMISKQGIYPSVHVPRHGRLFDLDHEWAGKK